VPHGITQCYLPPGRGDPLCHAFALYRDAEPAGGDVTCRRYDELSFVVNDANSVVYFTGRGTMQFEQYP